jgi:hypothetical protein
LHIGLLSKRSINQMNRAYTTPNNWVVLDYTCGPHIYAINARLTISKLPYNSELKLLKTYSLSDFRNDITDIRTSKERFWFNVTHQSITHMAVYRPILSCTFTRVNSQLPFWGPCSLIIKRLLRIYRLTFHQFHQC